MLVERTYTCGFCGEEIVVEVDLTAGHDQEYVEDCPVCCRPHVLRVRIEADGHVVLDSQAE